MKTITKTSSFRNQTQPGVLYVDKTEYLYKLSKLDGIFYSLSRPRWFGLSQLLDSLELMYRGEKDAFTDLRICETDYGWEKHPVIRLDLSICGYRTPLDMQSFLSHKITEEAEQYGISAGRTLDFRELCSTVIAKLSQLNKVVVLIDEADTPLRLNAGSRDIDEYVEVYKDLFSAILSAGNALQLCLIVSTTPLSRKRFCPALNDFTDLTFSDEFASICGCTQNELEKNYAEYVGIGCSESGLCHSAYIEKVKEWFGGYRFSPNGESVYHPGFLASFFQDGGTSFQDYWLLLGSIVRTLKEKAKAHDFTAASKFYISQQDLQDADIVNLMSPVNEETNIVRLFYYYGYLTIKDAVCGKGDYLLTLGFTNSGMKESFCELLTE